MGVYNNTGCTFTVITIPITDTVIIATTKTAAVTATNCSNYFHFRYKSQCNY